MNKTDLVRRGQIYWVDFVGGVGSTQNGIRPAVIVSNNVGNKYSPVIIVSPLTTKLSKKPLPTHIKIDDYKRAGLNKESQILAEQIITVSKEQVGEYIGSLEQGTMDKLNRALSISLELVNKRESIEVETAKKIASDISKIDEFVKMWLDYNSDITPIQVQMSERERKIKTLVKYATDKGLDYRNYYNPSL